MCLGESRRQTRERRTNGYAFGKALTHRTSSVKGCMYRSPISVGRDVGCVFSCLVWSCSASEATIYEDECPEYAARSWRLPGCEHMKRSRLDLGGVRTKFCKLASYGPKRDCSRPPAKLATHNVDWEQDAVNWLDTGKNRR